MRELSTNEVKMVSGAGIPATVGASIGSAIGGIVDAAVKLKGITTNFTAAFKLLGDSIGKIIEMKPFEAATAMTKAIVDIIAQSKIAKGEKNS